MLLSTCSTTVFKQILHLSGSLHVSFVRLVLCAARTIFYPYSTNQILFEVVRGISVVIFEVQSRLLPTKNWKQLFHFENRKKTFSTRG